MTTKLNIDGGEELYKSLTLSESVNRIGTWNATLPTVKNLVAFAPMTAVKDTVPIFGGRLQEPTNRFSRGGSVNNVRGFDYSVKLTDYLTPYSSIVDSSTDTTIDTILTNTPFTYSIESIFGYEYPLIYYDTWLEAMLEIETYVNTTPVIYLVNGIEISDKVNAGTWTGCKDGLKSTFYYNGATQRFYIFVKNVANDLYYYHSDDGDTWTGVDTGYNPSGDAWGVSWHDDKVYLFIYDGANTDFYRGTITDVNGAIVFGVATGNIFAGTIKFGPVWDSQGDMWVISSANSGTAWESTDDGATWSSEFSATDNGVDPFCGVGFELWGLADMNNDGDMMGIVFDSANTDLEEWLWDRNAGTFTFVAHIDGMPDIDLLDACQDADYNVYIIYYDNTANDTILSSNKSGAWVEDTLISDPALIVGICSDGYYAYASYGGDAGTRMWKYYGAVEIEDTGAIATYGTPTYLSCPRGYLQDGEVSVFFGVIDPSNSDIYFASFPLQYWRLVEAATTGSLQTVAITASGPMVRWGSLVTTGVQLTDTSWSVLKAADDSVIVSGQSNLFNLDNAGVPATETSIKLLADFTDTGIDPLLYTILLNESLDILSMELDYDVVYEALTRWSTLSGGEFWLDADDVLHLAYTRGSDKSGTIILKNSRTMRYPLVHPNIKVVDVKTDWTSYANSIRVLGAGTPPTRAEATLINQTQVDLYGAHWTPLRNKDLETDDMALSAASHELDQRATIIQRIKIDFLDEYDAGAIEIGDNVTLAALYGDDTDTEMDSAVRIVKLSRTFNSSGEHVSAECVNFVKANEFYNYLGSVNDLLRWIVS